MLPFDAGYNAEFLGIPVTANPWPVDSQAHEDWNNGWDDESIPF